MSIKSHTCTSVIEPLEGLKDENRNYKKIIRLAHTNAYLTNRYVNE